MAMLCQGVRWTPGGFRASPCRFSIQAQVRMHAGTRLHCGGSASVMRGPFDVWAHPEAGGAGHIVVVHPDPAGLECYAAACRHARHLSRPGCARLGVKGEVAGRPLIDDKAPAAHGLLSAEAVGAGVTAKPASEMALACAEQALEGACTAGSLIHAGIHLRLCMEVCRRPALQWEEAGGGGAHEPVQVRPKAQDWL